MIRSFALAVVLGMTLVCGPASAAEMDVDATHEFSLFRMIRTELDYASPRGGGLWNWDVHGWIGGDTHRLWLRSEGEIRRGRFETGEAQLFYGRNFATFWDGLIGARQDFAPKGRTYVSGSVVGLAPYFFETEASVFLSNKGELSARFKQSFDVLLTQRTIVEPHIEVNAFGKDVPDLNVGAGLSDIEAGLQLRYEIRRQFAPYIDLVWARKLGGTLGRVKTAGELPEETTIRFGIRSWF